MYISGSSLLSDKNYELVLRDDSTGRPSIALLRHHTDGETVSVVYQVDAEDVYSLFDPMHIILQELKALQDTLHEEQFRIDEAEHSFKSKEQALQLFHDNISKTVYETTEALILLIADIQTSSEALLF